MTPEPPPVNPSHTDGEQPPWILVMGASEGMGAAIARALARQGFSVLLCARSAERLADMAKVCKGIAKNSEQKFEHCTLDLMEPKSPGLLTSTLTRLSGTTHSPVPLLQGVLVNGGGPHGESGTSLTSDDLDAAHQLLFKGPVLHLQAALPFLKEGSQILALASTTVLEPHAALTLSGSYRSALVSYLKSLSDALGPRQISVNSIAPGFVATKRLDELRQHESRRLGLSPEQVNDTWARKAALGRLGTTEEIATLASFILGGGCPFLTGQVLVVDGGQVRSVH